MKDSLPDKLHELLRFALNDLKKVEQQSDVYKINMSVWHNANSHCSVCLAGSVMAKTLGVKPDESVLPYQFGPEIDAKLSALDSLRKGYIGSAYWELNHEEIYNILTVRNCQYLEGLEFLTHKDYDRIVQYEEDRNKFFLSMWEIQTQLEFYNL